MAKVGSTLIRNACEQYKKFVADHPGATKLYVPVAFAQLSDADFIDTLKKILKDTGIAPATLILEVPEDQALCNANVGTPVIKSLNTLGVKIAIINFNGDSSSLFCLKSLPIVALKLSAQLVQGIDQEANSTLVSAIIMVAECYGYTVIASNVKNDQQKRVLMEKGCKLMEGKLFN